MRRQENEEARIQVAQQELEEEKMLIEEEEAARKAYQAEEACKTEGALKALEAQEEARKAHEAEQARAQRKKARKAVYEVAERNRLKQKQGTSMQRITFNAWKNVMTEVRLANSHSDNAAAQTARNKLLRFKENRKPKTQVREGKNSAMLHAVVDGWKQYTAEARNQYAFVKHNTKSENAVSHALHKWDKTNKVYLRHEGLKVWLEVLKAAKLQRAKEIHDNRMKSTIEKMEDGKKESMQHCAFNTWNDATNEARHAKSHSNSAAAQAACFKVLRSKENCKIMTQMCEGNDAAMLQAIVGGCKKYLHETRYEITKKEKGKQHHEKGHNVIDKA